MSESCVKKVKNAWHRARNFNKKKSADGVVTKSNSPGMTLKKWAKHQVETGSSLAEECSQWLKNKKTLAQKSRTKK
jgi:hypothetical protein